MSELSQQEEEEERGQRLLLLFFWRTLTIFIYFDVFFCNFFLNKRCQLLWNYDNIIFFSNGNRANFFSKWIYFLFFHEHNFPFRFLACVKFSCVDPKKWKKKINSSESHVRNLIYSVIPFFYVYMLTSSWIWSVFNIF